jgi:hypothetical protein
MQYGDLVVPLFLARPGWRFVTSDMHDIARQVQVMHSGTRIVGYPQTGHLAVAVWVPRASLGKNATDDDVGQPVQASGGAWVLSFRLRNPDGTMRRHLEADVLEELRRKDIQRSHRGFDPRKLYNDLEAAHERLEDARLAATRDARIADIEVRAYANARRLRIPWRPNSIYVPGRPNGDNR